MSPTDPYQPDGRTNRQRMLAGDPYLADDPDLSAAAALAAARMAVYNAAADPADRQRLLVELLAAVGNGTVIRPPFYVDYGTHITIGSRCFANYGLVALDVCPITIGDDVQIGPNVQLMTPTHPLAPGPRRAKWEAGRPITIGDNVWLGGGVIVCPGVTIGPDTVVGAGAVVTKNLPPGVLAVGNPARVVRSLHDQAWQRKRAANRSVCGPDSCG